MGFNVNMFSSMNHASSTFLIVVLYKSTLLEFLSLVNFLVNHVLNGPRLKPCFIIPHTIDLDIPVACSMSLGIRWDPGTSSSYDNFLTSVQFWRTTFLNTISWKSQFIFFNGISSSPRIHFLLGNSFKCFLEEYLLSFDNV